MGERKAKVGAVVTVGIGAKALAEVAVPKATLPAQRGVRYAAISEKLIEGVELGTEALVESVRQGLIKGRDLAIVTGIMCDKLAAIEDRSGGGLPPASIDELEKRVALLLAAQEELKRRQREPIDVTPSGSSKNPL